MGKNLTIKGGENRFWLCQNILYNVLVLLIKCSSHLMGSHESMCWWKELLELAETFPCFSGAFSLAKWRSAFVYMAQDLPGVFSLAGQQCTKVLGSSVPSRSFSCTRLIQVFTDPPHWHCPPSVPVWSEKRPLTAPFPRDVILFCPHFGGPLPWYRQAKSCKSEIPVQPDLCVWFLVLPDQF